MGYASKNLIVITNDDMYTSKNKKLKLSDYKKLKNVFYNFLIENKDFSEINDTIQNVNLLNEFCECWGDDMFVRKISLLRTLRIWFKLASKQRDYLKKKYVEGYEFLKPKIVETLFLK